MKNHPLRILISSMLATHRFEVIAELQDELRIRGYDIGFDELKAIVQQLKVEIGSSQQKREEPFNQDNETFDVDIQDISAGIVDTFESDDDGFLLFDEVWDFDIPDDDFFDPKVNSEYVTRKLDQEENSRIADPNLVLANAEMLGLQGFDIKRYAQIVATLACQIEVIKLVDEGVGMDWGLPNGAYPDYKEWVQQETSDSGETE